MQCVIERDTRRYYAEIDKAEARSEAIDRRAAELLKKGEICYPYETANYSEALGEMSAVEVATIALKLSEGLNWQAGNMLHAQAWEYWLKKAELQAEKYIDDGGNRY